MIKIQGEWPTPSAQLKNTFNWRLVGDWGYPGPGYWAEVYQRLQRIEAAGVFKPHQAPASLGGQYYKLSQRIDMGISWAHTPEGSNYWATVRDNLQVIEAETKNFSVVEEDDEEHYVDVNEMYITDFHIDLPDVFSPGSEETQPKLRPYKPKRLTGPILNSKGDVEAF